MGKPNGILHCAGTEGGPVCRNTVEYPLSVAFPTVRPSIRRAGWVFRGTVTGWYWYCPVHEPSKEES